MRLPLECSPRPLDKGRSYRLQSESRLPPPALAGSHCPGAQHTELLYVSQPGSLSQSLNMVHSRGNLRGTTGFVQVDVDEVEYQAFTTVHTAST